MKQFRQGDILLTEVSEVPMAASRSDDNVLALGEVTGHSHKIQGQVEIFRIPEPRFRGDQRLPDDIYLKVSKGLLVHDEHKQIAIPQGIYRVTRQREYDPSATRLVND